MRLTYHAKMFPFIGRHLTYKIAMVKMKNTVKTRM